MSRRRKRKPTTFPVEYKAAKAAAPKAAKAIKTALRKSRSRRRKVALKNIAWTFIWTEAKGEQPEGNLDERIAARVERSTVKLRGKVPNWSKDVVTAGVPHAVWKVIQAEETAKLQATVDSVRRSKKKARLERLMRQRVEVRLWGRTWTTGLYDPLRDPVYVTQERAAAIAAVTMLPAQEPGVYLTIHTREHGFRLVPTRRIRRRQGTKYTFPFADMTFPAPPEPELLSAPKG